MRVATFIKTDNSRKNYYSSSTVVKTVKTPVTDQAMGRGVCCSYYDTSP